MLKIFHTSDWHLGRSLYGRKRYDEFKNFLDWLAQNIYNHEIDILLICGDVFDTANPSNTALELYYNFLHKISTSSCKHVVIIAGNHDSPSLLEAPKHLLKILNIHVLGVAHIEDAKNDVLHLVCEKGEVLLCATPYLRDKDLRQVIAGEDRNSQNSKMLSNIQNHYNQLAKYACQQQEEILTSKGYKIPIITTGHLFAAGGKTFNDDGVRDLYVGSLLFVGADTFSENFDYVALGHLHLAQCVNKNESIRYSGSPIPMGFNEAGKAKQIILIEFNFQGKEIIKNIQQIEIPCFQELVKIVGNLEQIQNRLFELISINSRAWLEIEYTGQELVANLSSVLEEAVCNSHLKIIRIKNNKALQLTMEASSIDENLADLNEHEVFERCLETYDIQEDEKKLLTESYNEILQIFYEQDKNLE